MREKEKREREGKRKERKEEERKNKEKEGRERDLNWLNQLFRRFRDRFHLEVERASERGVKETRGEGNVKEKEEKIRFHALKKKEKKKIIKWRQRNDLLLSGGFFLLISRKRKKQRKKAEETNCSQIEIQFTPCLSLICMYGLCFNAICCCCKRPLKQWKLTPQKIWVFSLFFSFVLERQKKRKKRENLPRFFGSKFEIYKHEMRFF